MKRSLMFLCFILCFGVTTVVHASTTSSPHPTLYFYGAKDGVAGDPDCKDNYGDCIILLSNPIAVSEYTYSVSEKGKPAISINLSTSDGAKLTELSRKYLGKQIALVIENLVVHVGKVRAVTNLTGIGVDFCDRRNFEVTRGALTGDQAAIKKFRTHKWIKCQS